MVAPGFIARKLRFQGKLAAAAMAVSFFVMLVAVAVSAGFRSSIREGLSALGGDLTLLPHTSAYGDDPVPMPLHLPSEAALAAVPGVESLQGVAARAGIVKEGELVHGVLVKGVERPDSALCVSIPQRLSALTGLGAGDQLTVYFIGGEKLRVRRFSITAVHPDLLELDSRLVVYANLSDIQRLNGWDGDSVSAIEVRLKDASRGKVAYAAEELASILLESDDPHEERLYVSSAQQQFPQLFDWLDLLDRNVLIVLVLMTIVAAFNMVSGLLTVLLRNISTVGTLKTLGMTNRAVEGVFLRVGGRAAFWGMLCGNAAALLFCFLQGRFHLIPLNPVNYYVAWVPVRLSLPQVLLADAAAFAVVLLFLALGVRLVGRIDPARTVKAD